jgi:hypothetical protein
MIWAETLAPGRLPPVCRVRVFHGKPAWELDVAYLRPTDPREVDPESGTDTAVWTEKLEKVGSWTVWARTWEASPCNNPAEASKTKVRKSLRFQ